VLTCSRGREATGYNHGYDAEVFYLGLALDPAYIKGFVEGCLERIGEDDPEGEDLLRGEWEDGEKERLLCPPSLHGVGVEEAYTPT
jgi:hypothetical protein